MQLVLGEKTSYPWFYSQSKVTWILAAQLWLYLTFPSLSQ